MHLYSLFTEAELSDQIEKKMVKMQFHPSSPLTILNYTQQAIFTPEHWNHVTDKCRGIIYDSRTLEVIARPFQKFWNINDARHPETMMENLPSSAPTLTRKMDGSLGIAYQMDGKWSIATRGSFTSEQAKWATGWLMQQDRFHLPRNCTALFEIIYPENQIVVRYTHSGLTLLAVVVNETGEEWGRKDCEMLVALNPYLRLVEAYDRPLASCMTEDSENEEGYVAAWDRSGSPPLRVKIKYETYCRLHKLLTQTNAVTVWEMLRDGLNVESLTADAPTEFRGWIDSLDARFRGEYKRIEDAALVAMLNYPGEKMITNPEQKKSFALYVTANHSAVAPIMFAMVSGKNYAPIIWKMTRPRGDEKTFKIDEA